MASDACERTCLVPHSFRLLPFGLPFAALITADRYFGFISKNSWSGFPAEFYRFVFGVFFFGLIMGWWIWRSGERGFHASGSE
jgi:hypothetical protein